MMINDPVHASTICLAYGEPSVSVSSYCCSHHSSRSCVSFMAPSPTNEWRYETSEAWRRPWPLVSAEKENASIRCASERRLNHARQALAFVIHGRWKKELQPRSLNLIAFNHLGSFSRFLLRVSLVPRKRCFNSGERLACVTLVDVWSRMEAYSITLVWQKVELMATCPRSWGLLTSMTIFSYQSMVSFPSPLMHSSITVDWACVHLLALFCD